MPEDATLAPAPAALDFLLSRRSRVAKSLTGPGPDRATLETLLTAAARSPDHGKLEPWRFIVLEGAAKTALAALTRELGPARGRDADRAAREAEPYETSPVVIAVVVSPVASEKVPEAEQVLSAGAVCLGLLNAALASGWGANWLSGWMAHDAEFGRRALELGEGEWVAGFVHLGTPTMTPADRPRPDLSKKVEWRG